MKKNVLMAVIAAVTFIIAAGSWYYYHFYIDTVNDYFLVKYTPPQMRESIFGKCEYSDPKIEVSQLEKYANDDIALETETKKAKDTYSWLLKKYEEELSTPKEDNPILQNARINAITSMLDEERFLIRTTHIRKFNPDEALKMVQEHWMDGVLEDYAKTQKVDVAVYNISKI